MRPSGNNGLFFVFGFHPFDYAVSGYESLCVYPTWDSFSIVGIWINDSHQFRETCPRFLQTFCSVLFFSLHSQYMYVSTPDIISKFRVLSISP